MLKATMAAAAVAGAGCAARVEQASFSGHGTSHGVPTLKDNVLYENLQVREPATSIAYAPVHFDPVEIIRARVRGQDVEGVTSPSAPPRFALAPQSTGSAARLSKENAQRLIQAVTGKREWDADLARIYLESICNEKDLSQAVESYDGSFPKVSKQFVADHQPMVGQLQWNFDLGAKYDNAGNVSGRRWCSGTLISEDLFLAAGHCFDAEEDDPAGGSGWQLPRANDSGEPIPPKEIAVNMHVGFNFQIDPSSRKVRKEDRHAVVELLEYRLGKLDYAIVRLDGSPGKKWGFARVSRVDATENETLCLIGHPGGAPKRVASGPATDFQDTRVGYNTLDTVGGDSGAGLLGESGWLVGVHTNGGCHYPQRGHNYGQCIASLVAVSPTLAKLAADPPKNG
jgi:V8-like Glu-specific endopeptidase